MPPFPRPRVQYAYNVKKEIRALHDYQVARPDRKIPPTAADRLLLATWNIANLGGQKRTNDDHRLIAEIISWFDLVAVQESNDNLAGINAVLEYLPASYRLLFSNAADNNERLTFVYDSKKVTQLEQVGEVTVPPRDIRYITLPGIRQKFQGFDRSPYIGSFQAGKFRFLVVNAHLYFGDDKAKASIDRRCLEAFAVARWADQRQKSKNAFTNDIIVVGDLNLPKVDEKDPVYRALTKRGLRLPDHSTRIGSNLASDEHYDQIMFFPASYAKRLHRAHGRLRFRWRAVPRSLGARRQSQTPGAV